MNAGAISFQPLSNGIGVSLDTPSRIITNSGLGDGASNRDPENDPNSLILSNVVLLAPSKLWYCDTPRRWAIISRASSGDTVAGSVCLDRVSPSRMKKLAREKTSDAAKAVVAKAGNNKLVESLMVVRRS